MAQVAYCDGLIQVATGQAAPFRCVANSGSTGAWLFRDAPLPFDVSQIDPVIFLEFFVSGFALTVTPYAAAWCMALVVKSIRS